MNTSGKCLLLFALMLFMSHQNVRAFGFEDFQDLDFYPVNTYKNRVIFYTDLDCDPDSCQRTCSALSFGTGLCSGTPRACVCNAKTELNSKVVTFNGGQTRIHQFANDWAVYPPLKCEYPGISANPNDFCDRSCKQHGLMMGLCLKFTAKTSVCACKMHRRGAIDFERDTLVTAPFAPLATKQSIAVKNASNSVYLSSNLCVKQDCQNICTKFNLANGICDDYYNKPACKCDTGMPENRVVTDLQIKAYAGGIYTLNGWHLFEHDPEVGCTEKDCGFVCQFWGFEKESACFQGNGITNSCGCKDYDSNAPSKDELDEARKSFSASSQLQAVMCTLVFALIFLIWL